MNFKNALLYTSFFLILLINCKSPTSNEIIRINPNDPFSQNFDPKLAFNSTFEVSALDLNTIKVSWPQVIGIKKYELFRKTPYQSSFNLIYEESNDADTTYIDTVPETGNYSYKINYISHNADTLSFISNTILSSWIEGPKFSLDVNEIRISPSQSFSMKTGENSAMIHYLRPNSQTPILTKLNLENNEWNIIAYGDLGATEDWVRSDDFYRIDNNRFIIIKKFTRQQSNLGYVCEISPNSCSKIGTNTLHEDANFRYISFTNLNDGRILFTGGEVTWTLLNSFAFIFDPESNSVVKISSPLNKMIPETLTSLKNGNVLGCQLGIEIDSSPVCQIYNIQTDKWSSTSSIPEPFFEMNSILLDEQRVLFISGGNISTPKYNAWIYDSELNTWEPTNSPTFSTQRINFSSFTNSLERTEKGNIVAITHSNDEQNQYGKANYFLEEYSPESNTWINIYMLPDYVKSIFNFIKIDSGKYLITYNKGQYPAEPYTAVIYIE
tara:strand:- start:3276 stop:4763 length:1488 start_codon:yes stop_codon:yes gene_type:complete